MKERLHEPRVFVPGIVLGAFLLHLAQGLVLDGPWLVEHELAYADGARALVLDAPDGARTLASFLLAPLWLADAATGYALVKAAGAAAAALSAPPAYALARELGAPRAGAALAAAAVAAGPVTLLASTTLPVALAYPAAALGLLELVRRRPVRGLSALALAGLLWFPFLLLAAAALFAVLGRDALEWPGAAALLALPPAAYAASHLGGGPEDLAAVLGAFAGIAAPVAAARFGRVVPAAAALGLALALELAAFGAADPRPRVDLPTDERVAVLTRPGVAVREDVLRFWNPVARVARPALHRRTYDPRTGRFAPPLRTPGLVFDEAGIRLDGTEVTRTPAGVLLRTPPEARAAETYEGLHPDGWSGPELSYRRFAPGDARTVRVTMSRAEFKAAEAPSVVQISVGPLSGPLVQRFAIVLRAGEEQAVSVPVPPPPFRVRVTFDPPFSPASYGSTDTRQLGAKTIFTYGG